MELSIICKAMFKAYTLMAVWYIVEESKNMQRSTKTLDAFYNYNTAFMKLGIAMFVVMIGLPLGYFDIQLNETACQIALMLFFISIARKP